jgi:hypothetical protein
MYSCIENGKMRPVETTPKMGMKMNDGRGKFNYDKL